MPSHGILKDVIICWKLMLHGSPQFLKFEEVILERETLLRKNMPKLLGMNLGECHFQNFQYVTFDKCWIMLEDTLVVSRALNICWIISISTKFLLGTHFADILSAHKILLVLNSLTKSSLKTQSCPIKMYVNVYSYVHLQYRKSKSQMYVWYIVV